MAAQPTRGARRPARRIASRRRRRPAAQTPQFSNPGQRIHQVQQTKGALCGRQVGQRALQWRRETRHSAAGDHDHQGEQANEQAAQQQAPRCPVSRPQRRVHVGACIWGWGHVSRDKAGCAQMPCGTLWRLGARKPRIARTKPDTVTIAAMRGGDMGSRLYPSLGPQPCRVMKKVPQLGRECGELGRDEFPLRAGLCPRAWGRTPACEVVAQRSADARRGPLRRLIIGIDSTTPNHEAPYANERFMDRCM